MDESNIIEAKNLAVGYGKKKVISHINITVKKGQMICLLGPNGTGKSTILRTLSGHLQPLEGEIRLYGKEIHKIKKKELAKVLSVVLTEKIDPELITVTQMVTLGRQPHTNFWGELSKKDKKIVTDCLELVHATHLKDRYYSTLSDGEKQKVMIARALAQEPKVIVLDEPTSHLDVKHKVEVLSILRKMSRDKGIITIISLHDVDLALKTCDVIVMLKDGKVVDWGLPDRIIKPNTIGNLYDIEAAGYNHKLGCMELLSCEGGRVFVLAGGGTGIPIYRTLSKNSIGFSTGILYENDIDTYISSTMKAKTITIKNSKEIAKAIQKAKEAIDSCEILIDGGYESEEVESCKSNLINYAIAKNKRIISLSKNKISLKIHPMTYLQEQLHKMLHCEQDESQEKEYIVLGECR
ncbi:ABC transporter ATP-binding protein [Alkalibaculum bacchi]|uniref:ABC transporter ATP-binding protein n=1 Tax=Alkalibaculum bacchi TaxID=645887 RepID=UPI0026EE21E0|nr:ABC transporter ATP-binding protein [Alkalibaculum bacchi]